MKVDCKDRAEATVERLSKLCCGVNLNERGECQTATHFKRMIQYTGAETHCKAP